MNTAVHLLLALSRPFREGHLVHADGSVYMRRFALFETPWLSMRLHHIVTPDLDRDLHDHPWNFTSVLLSGGYTEERPQNWKHPQWDGDVELRAGWRREAPSIAFRRATDRHLISAVDPDTWSLFIYGKGVQWWGFYTRAGKVHWRDYISVHSIQ